MNLTSEANNFEEIVLLIEQGVSCWETAGRLISDRRQLDKDCYAKIIEQRPWMTLSMLHTLERIGRREVYPYAMLERSNVGRRLLGYSYDEQKRICTEGIDVLLYFKAGKPFYQKKALHSLTGPEVKQVFGPLRTRKPEEQLQYLASHVDPLLTKGRKFGSLQSEALKPAELEVEDVRRDTIGLFKLTLTQGSTICERVLSLPPGAPTIEAENRSGKLVCYVRVVQRQARLDTPTERELEWRKLREEMGIKDPDGVEVNEG